MNINYKEILEWVYCIIIAVVLALLVRYFLGTPTIVKQVSMYPTLVEGQRLILNRWERTTGKNYKKGDNVTPRLFPVVLLLIKIIFLINL